MDKFEQKYKGLSLREMVLVMRDLRDQHTVTKNVASKLWVEHEYLSKKLIPEMMEELGYNQIDFEGIGRLEIRNELSCSIPKENKEDVYEWIRNNGYEDLIQGTINSGTFKAQVKKWVKDGEDFPMELINFNPYDNAVLIRVK